MASSWQTVKQNACNNKQLHATNELLLFARLIIALRAPGQAAPLCLASHLFDQTAATTNTITITTTLFF